MYTKVEEQSVTEARRDFTKSLKRLASSEDGELAILVHRHGVPVGGILPPQALAKWLSEQARASQGSFAKLAQRLSEARDETSEAETSLNLPKGWSTPEAYSRKHFAEGHSAKAIFEGLKEHYGEQGLTIKEAARIVGDIAKEQGIETE